MKEVHAVEGWDLRLPPEARQRLGGMVRPISIGKYCWSPDPGDRLYKVGRWQGEVSEGDYYILRKPDGDILYLECIHPMDPPSVLVVLRENRVPQWMREAVAKARDEGVI